MESQSAHQECLASSYPIPHMFQYHRIVFLISNSPFEQSKDRIVRIMLQPFVRRFATKVLTKKQTFFDATTVRVIGGTGGRGVSSFQSGLLEIILIISDSSRKMTPTGGNGGKGGNVYIRVNSHLDSLIIPKSVYKAENGSNGKGKCQHGRGGRDLYIDIPIGTLVYDLMINEQHDGSPQTKEILRSFEQQMYEHMGSKYDLVKESMGSKENDEITKELIFDSTFSNHFDVFCVAYGGKGGEGNHEWYERSKRQNLRYWGSNRDRRLQATYYRVVVQNQPNL